MKKRNKWTKSYCDMCKDARTCPDRYKSVEGKPTIISAP